MNKNVSLAILFAATSLGSAMAGTLRNPFANISLLDSSRVHDLDEVVVISQPKEFQRLRQQSLSSSVFSSKEIYSLGARDIRELSVFVPSFAMPNYGSRITSSMYMRGIGSRVNSPAVGFYLDGMPLISKSAFNFHTYQLDRVDVLRGPQGTLYGQNTEGGLVRLYTKNPLNYQGTDVNLGIGSRLYRNVEFAHYSKFSDKFGMSLAGFYNGQNGFFRNTYSGEHADKYNEAGGRLRLVAEPTDRISLNFLADYQYVNQNGFPYGMLDAKTGSTAMPNTNRQSGYRRNMLNTAFTVGFKANYFDFTSTTSYQYLRDNMLMDQDYLPQDYMHLEQRQLQNAITQEFAFKGNHAVGGFWHWAFGTYFSSQWLKTDSPVYFDDDMNKMLSNGITAYAYNGMLQAMAKRMGEQQAADLIKRMGGCKINMTMSTVPGLFHTPTTNLAFYHESAFDITKRLTATLGLRYDYSHVSIDYATSASVKLSEDVMGQHVDALVSTYLNNKNHDDFDQLLPKFGLNYRINDDGSNVYATVSKGYRAGGFNMQMFSDVLQTELSASAQSAHGNVVLQHDAQYYDNISKTISYKPETSWNYEVGTHMNLFNNSIHFDFSAYYMQINNQQLSVMAGNYGFGRMMTNAGKSYSCGIEACLRGNAFNDHLTWGVSYGLTHAAFKDYIDGEGAKAVDYSGKYVPFVPMHTIGGYGDYRFDMSCGMLKSITLGANVNAQGKTYWDEANTYSQNLYAVLGAHADADFGKVLISFWGRNLTDTKYNTFAVQTAATGVNYTFAQLGNPFQCGVDVRLHF
ncbi:MAG: TonB-dependent receptor [Prevotella sp.]|nr:TonB-dependent receptor [Prevotella sp.]MBP7097559.1 TonB-dependent receptor [Prevotella sp.]